jgi:hypothetical protein
MNGKILCIGSLLALVAAVGTAWPQTAPATTTAPATATASSTRVTGQLIVPADVASFSDKTADLLLFEYDPRLAGAPAQQVDHLVIKPFAHEKGTETSVEFRIGGTSAWSASRSYYVTAFVLDAATRTHIGEIDGKSGLSKVLTGGNPRDIKLIFRAVK